MSPLPGLISNPNIPFGIEDKSKIQGWPKVRGFPNRNSLYKQ